MRSLISPGACRGCGSNWNAADRCTGRSGRCTAFELVRVEDVVETALASPTEAGLLGVDTGLPMLPIHRTAWAADGRPVEWIRSVFRGDRFRFVARSELPRREPDQPVRSETHPSLIRPMVAGVR